MSVLGFSILFFSRYDSRNASAYHPSWFSFRIASSTSWVCLKDLYVMYVCILRLVSLFRMKTPFTRYLSFRCFCSRWCSKLKPASTCLCLVHVAPNERVLACNSPSRKAGRQFHHNPTLYVTLELDTWAYRWYRCIYVWIRSFIRWRRKSSQKCKWNCACLLPLDKFVITLAIAQSMHRYAHTYALAKSMLPHADPIVLCWPENFLQRHG